MAKDVNTMPYNRDAEMALLGCLLIDNEITSELVEKLTEDDFYQESHKYILRAMQRVFNSRKPVDLVTVSDELENEATIEKAGGIVYLTELAQIVPSAANYKSYYEIVTRDSVNRKLIRASRKIIETSMQGADEKTALAFAEKSIYDISKQTERSALLGMADDDIIGEVLQKFELLQSDQNAYKGIPTGFKRLDKVIVTQGRASADPDACALKLFHKLHRLALVHRYSYSRSLREKFNCRRVIKIFRFHHEGDRVSSCATAEAIERLRCGKNSEGRRFFTVIGAQPAEI